METLWGKGPHQEELEDLRAERAALQSGRSKGVWEVVRDPALRWQLYMLVLTVVAMQLSGINAVEWSGATGEGGQVAGCASQGASG